MGDAASTAFVFLALYEDRVERFHLHSGDYVAGSSPDCDIRLHHPSVSRRHVSFLVEADRVMVTDLGSSNGTRLDGHELQAPEQVARPAELLLGSLRAQLDLIPDDDVKLGVAAEPSGETRPDTEEPQAPALTTVGPAALERFAFHHLPRLASSLAAGASLNELAQEVGSALFESLPCRRVEIADQSSAGDSGVLFSASRPGSSGIRTLTSEGRHGLRVAVDFLSSSFASNYEPLVHSAEAFVAAARARPQTHSGAPARTHEPTAEPPRPPSVDAEVRSVYAQAARIAPSTVSVLILGESGTGKELLARYLHAASTRPAEPLITLNCAALPRDLLESELFGVERGVATGVEARPGKFEAAHGGTLFLDEIGDMAPETQARILRVLQERVVYRLGGHAARPAEVRVISATNRNIRALIDEGHFRSDLFHRIADWVVELPPLRRRRADIANLAVHFLSHACSERGVRIRGISRAALEALLRYPWPGNVRELEREMKRAALFLEDGEMLDTARLQQRFLEGGGSAPGDSLKTVLESSEREHIVRILSECDGSVAEAAERLEIGLSTLYRRMKSLGID